MAADLIQHLGVIAQLTPGSGGVFEVIADGKLIFSKKAVGRFPEEGEIVGMLRPS